MLFVSLAKGSVSLAVYPKRFSLADYFACVDVCSFSDFACHTISTRFVWKADDSQLSDKWLSHAWTCCHRYATAMYEVWICLVALFSLQSC